MIILSIRTDKPEAELGLWSNEKLLAYKKWEAHRHLAETIHTTIKELLTQQQQDWHNIEGIVCFEGPGSFTGLRIGLTVGNTLAYSLTVPIVAAGGAQWIQHGIARLLKGATDPLALPRYGSPVHISKPKARKTA